MRRILIITAVVQYLSSFCSQAVTLPFEQNDVEPFYSPELQVVWSATNKLPNTVKIFKVVPANFSASAVSNLTAMGGAVNHKLGWMNLYKPTDDRSPLENVPDKARAFELGMNLLAKLEIPIGELMSENGKVLAGYSPGTRTHMDKATHKAITEPCTMGVTFGRVLNGVVCFGQQVHIQFESQETVTQLEVRWNGVEANKTSVIATPDQIISWIKEGRARAHPVETTGQRWIRVADIKKVTIRQVNLCYDASPDWENTKKIPNYLYPYVAIQAEVEFSPDDHETVGISCPVIKEALSDAIRKSSEFNIFPSTLYEKLGRKKGGE
jgi:hypothetical protein